MTYAIANVIYGIDLTNFPWDQTDLDENEVEVFDELSHSYSGNGDPPIWLGPEIWSFDECNNFPLSELIENTKVTPEIEKEWEEALEGLHPEILRVLKKYIEDHPQSGYTLEPKVWILWGSS